MKTILVRPAVEILPSIIALSILLFPSAGKMLGADDPSPNPDAEIVIETKVVVMPASVRGKMLDLQKKLGINEPKDGGSISPLLMDSIKKPLEIPKSATGIIKQLETGTNGAMNLRADIGVDAVFTKTEYDATINALAESGCEIVSQPSITLKDGEEGKIKITRKFNYTATPQQGEKPPPSASPAQFNTQEVGEILSVKPTIFVGGIDLDIKTTAINPLGLLIGNGGEMTLVPVSTKKPRAKYVRPVFTTAGSELVNTSVSVWAEGQTVSITTVMLEMQAVANGANPEVERKTVQILITARVVKAKNNIEPSHSATGHSAPADR